MSLQDYKAPTHTVPLNGGQGITVRALNLFDFAAIAKEYGTELAAVAAVLKGGDWAHADQSEVIQLALSIAPGLIAHAVALAADEPDAASQAGKLPLPTVILAFTAVVRLTLDSVGGMPGLAALVVDLFATGDAETTTAAPAVEV